MNNKILTIYSVVLTIAVLFLFWKTSTKNEAEIVDKSGASTSAATASSTIAYVNIDSLMEKISYAKEYNKSINAEKTSIESKYQTLAKNWERKVTQYQEKARMGSLTAQEYQTTEQNLAMEQEDIVRRREKDLSDLMEKDSKNNKKFVDDLNSYIQDYNKDGKYKYIFSYLKNGNILYADSAADITNDIVTGLNDKYAKTK